MKVSIRCAGFQDPSPIERRIKVYQTRPFASTKEDRDKSSQNQHIDVHQSNERPFTCIYESDVSTSIGSCFPSSIAQLQKIPPGNFDCTIHIAVFGPDGSEGKEIAEVFLSYSDLLDRLANAQILEFDLINVDLDLHDQLKLYIVPFKSFPDVIINNPLQPVNLTAEILSYESVFYDQGFNARRVEVQETASEPIHTVRISDLFMQNMIVSLTGAVDAWKQRFSIERMRQGHFASTQEALNHGWSAISVTVGSANIVFKSDVVKSVSGLKEAGNFRAPYTTSVASSSSSSSSSISSSSSSVPPVEKGEINNDDSSFGLARVNTMPTSSASLSAQASMRQLEAGSKPMITHEQFMLASLDKRNPVVDLLYPSTFVDIGIVDYEQAVIFEVGRTNVEHYTARPQFGSRINDHVLPKNYFNNRGGPSSHNCKAFGSSTLINTPTPFITKLDSSLFMPPTSTASTGIEKDAVIMSEGSRATFVKFVPNLGSSSIELQLFATDIFGKSADMMLPSSSVGNRARSVSADISGNSSGGGNGSGINGDDGNHAMMGEALIGSISIELHDDVDKGLTTITVPINVEEQFQNVISSAEITVSIRINDPNLVLPKKIVEPTKDSTVGFSYNVCEIFKSSIPSGSFRVPVHSDKGYIFNRGKQGRLQELEGQTFTSVNRDEDASSSSTSAGAEAEAATKSSTGYDFDLDVMQNISDCYDWLWLIGYSGMDPLLSNFIGEASSNGTDEGHSKSGDSSSGVDIGGGSSSSSRRESFTGRLNDDDDERPDSHTNCPALDKFYDENDVDDRVTASFIALGKVELENFSSILKQIDNTQRQARVKDGQTTIGSGLILEEGKVEGGRGNRNHTIERLDCQYPLERIIENILELESILEEFFDCQAEVQGLSRQGKTFRSSSEKKNMDKQSLACNLHYQTMITRHHGVEEINSHVTSGCFGIHAFGYKKGGIISIEKRLIALKKEIDGKKKEIQDYLESNVNAMVPKRQTDAVGNHVGMLLSELAIVTAEYDEQCIMFARRRTYAVSQAISVSFNSLLLKIAMVNSGVLDFHTHADVWLLHGFPLFFQGLLTVSGDEKGMIEDTFSAIEAMDYFTVNVLKDVDPENISDEFDEFAAYGAAKTPDQETLRKSIRKSQLLEKTPLSEQNRVKLLMTGRQIDMLIPKTLCDKFAPKFQLLLEQPWGFLINFHTFFFSQGINIQQALKISSDPLQNAINLYSFYKLNRFYQILDKDNKAKAVLLERIADANENDEATSVASQEFLHEMSESSKEMRVKSIRATLLKRGSVMSHAFGAENIDLHPNLVSMSNSLQDSSSHSQQVSLLLEIEQASEWCRGCSVTFCKSGKDRTGMVVTYRQARKVDSVMYDDRSSSSSSSSSSSTSSSSASITTTSSSTSNGTKVENSSSPIGEQSAHNAARVQRISDYFRLYGCRLSICEKNIGKREYAMNMIQCKFLPSVFIPPTATMGEMLRDNS